MLFKELNKIKSSDFNFHNIDHKLMQKKQHWLKNMIWSFVGLQCIFAAYNLSRLDTYLDELAIASNDSSSLYESLTNSLKKGNQSDIINHFINLKKANLESTDLLSAYVLTNIYISEDIQAERDYINEHFKKEQDIALKNKDKEKTVENIIKLKYHLKSLDEKYFHYNVTPETKKILVSIYMNNLNSGFNKEKHALDNVACFFLDISCHVGVSWRQNAIEPLQALTESRLKAATYDINHPEEYKQWHKQLRYKMNAKVLTFEDWESPGNMLFGKKPYIYMEQKISNIVKMTIS